TKNRPHKVGRSPLGGPHDKCIWGILRERELYFDLFYNFFLYLVHYRKAIYLKIFLLIQEKVVAGFSE
ncbi:hypothetical protein J8J32_20920, partial [Mycobacterium tuberculosis]|uniref:hypothetical protein n=1 Tax=Mycobacterium tuberculosis TaxID=1773 RepID=UPI001ADFD101